MEDNNKSYFHQKGNQFRVTPKANLNLFETLPPATYSVNYDEKRSQYYLETINDFQLKSKIYGNVVGNSTRILNTFLDRERSTGVLLVGEKGSGKTLLAQYISISAAKGNGIPTIVINKPWHGDRFNSFLQNISQPVIILMDEFEKVYTMRGRENLQEKILTLFDGVYASQKLFLLTCNNKHRIDRHMMNRPGRLYYLLEFNGLEQTFIREYCEDKLLQRGYIPAVAAVAALFRSFNFDMLKAIVDDMNRYGESPSEVLKYLNVRPDFEGSQNFNVKLTVDGEKKDKKHVQPRWSGTPLSSQVIRILSKDGTKKRGTKGHCFSTKDLRKLDPKTRVFEFENEAGDVLTLTPVPVPRFSLDYGMFMSASSCLDETPFEDDTCDTVSATEEESSEAMVS